VDPRNLLAALPADRSREAVEALLEGPGLRLERIVSFGQATPPGQWYDQRAHEWVALLQGSAALRFEDEPAPRVLRAGDSVLIPAHRRHRVDWTDPGQPTIWLALHYGEAAAPVPPAGPAPGARP
jgi:cupin 2 domain-containing protein